MKRILCIGFLVFLIFAHVEGKTPKVVHLVLIDNSGSMTHWFLKDPKFMSELTQDFLLSTQVFRDGDELIIRSFNNAFGINQKVEFRDQDPDRICVFTERRNGKSLNSSNRNELLQQFNDKFRGTPLGDTDLKEALELALLDMNRFLGRKEGVIIWILSDNRQDLGVEDTLKGTGIPPIVEFYYYLYDNPSIRRSYFFPIIRDPNIPQKNLVCYAMLYHPEGDMLIEGEVQEVTSRINAAGATLATLTEGKHTSIPPILCKPTETEPFALDQRITFKSDKEDIKEKRENNQIAFTGLQERKGFRGTLYLDFISRFKYWRIENAKLEDPVLSFSPNQILEGPKQSKCKITPKEITVSPGERTDRKYQLFLRSGNEDLFIPLVKKFSLKTFLPGAKENLYGKLKFKIRINANLMRLILPGMEEEIEKVNMLPAIRDFMFPQRNVASEVVKSFEYPVKFEVSFASWRVILFFAFIFLVLVLLSVVIFLALSKVEGSWAIADSSKGFKLHFLTKEQVKLGTEGLGRLTYIPGSGAKFVVTPSSKLTGGERKKKLVPGENVLEVYLKDVKHKLKVFIKPKKRTKIKKETPSKKY
jgi:hypothetical protein